jgi:amino acid transporter
MLNTTRMYAFANDIHSFYEALLIPFEISAFTLVISFWSDKIAEPGPTAGIVTGCIICYA